MSQAVRAARAAAARDPDVTEEMRFMKEGVGGDQATVKSSGLKSMRLAWETASLMARTARQHL